MSWPGRPDPNHNAQDLAGVAALRQSLKRFLQDHLPQLEDLIRIPPPAPFWPPAVPAATPSSSAQGKLGELLQELQSLTDRAATTLAELLPPLQQHVPPPPPPPPALLTQIHRGLQGFVSSVPTMAADMSKKFDGLLRTVAPALGLSESPTQVYIRMALCFAGAAAATGFATYSLGQWLYSEEPSRPSLLGVLLGVKAEDPAAAKLAAEAAELESKRRMEAAERFFHRPNVFRNLAEGAKDCKDLECRLHQMVDQLCCEFDAMPPAALPGLKRATSTILMAEVPEEAQNRELSAEKARQLSERVIRQAIQTA